VLVDAVLALGVIAGAEPSRERDGVLFAVFGLESLDGVGGAVFADRETTGVAIGVGVGGGMKVVVEEIRRKYDEIQPEKNSR
jgi:hypothetical protein